MPKPTEQKRVQARILKYAEEIGWSIISRTEAEHRRGFNAVSNSIQERCGTASLYFEDLLYDKQLKEITKNVGYAGNIKRGH